MAFKYIGKLLLSSVSRYTSDTLNIYNFETHSPFFSHRMILLPISHFSFLLLLGYKYIYNLACRRLFSAFLLSKPHPYICVLVPVLVVCSWLAYHPKISGFTTTCLLSCAVCGLTGLSQALLSGLRHTIEVRCWLELQSSELWTEQDIQDAHSLAGR